MIHISNDKKIAPILFTFYLFTTPEANTEYDSLR